MMSSRPLTSLSYASRREVVARVAPEYREASCAQKTLLLDTIVTMTGYARKYAIRLLMSASCTPSASLLLVVFPPHKQDRSSSTRSPFAPLDF